MAGGKPVQGGVRIRLAQGVTWDQLAGLSPEEIQRRDIWPAGFYPLPHPHHEAGGMVFPQPTIDETKRQTGRDLTRFDLDYDLPQHMLPEFPAPIFLTTRPDLGDVSHGEVVTTDNYYLLFKDILNLKQLDGLRLLVTPFPQQQFNATDDRRHLGPAPPAGKCRHRPPTHSGFQARGLPGSPTVRLRPCDRRGGQPVLGSR